VSLGRDSDWSRGVSGRTKDPLLPDRGTTASPRYTATITPAMAPSTPQRSHPPGWVSAASVFAFTRHATRRCPGLLHVSGSLWTNTAAGHQPLELTQVKQSVPLLVGSLRVPPFTGKIGLSWASGTSPDQVSELRE